MLQRHWRYRSRSLSISDCGEPFINAHIKDSDCESERLRCEACAKRIGCAHDDTGKDGAKREASESDGRVCSTICDLRGADGNGVLDI